MIASSRPVFSVVIPTLQRAPELKPLVHECAEHPLVLEVLVINNSPVPLRWPSPKVRVLQQAENIFVNPAWNLGAREARGDLLAILNDDISFDVSMFEDVSRVLGTSGVGIVGPHASCYSGREGGSFHIRPALEPGPFFGTCIFLRREDYVNIPEDMPIWGGDDWLFFHSRGMPMEFRGVSMRTDMSTTTRSPEFQALHDLNFQASMRHLGAVYPHGIGRGILGARWWHTARLVQLGARRLWRPFLSRLRAHRPHS